jgi:EAL and modified HD-GYP domain-containing signal transduction protein
LSAVPNTKDSIADAPTDKHVFVGRQPILNRQQRVIAYELLFRGSAAAQAANLTKAPESTCGLLIDSFKLLGLDNVLGSKRAHVNVSADELLGDAIAALPPERLVFEIVENTKATDALIARCRDLRRAGYRFALDNFVYRRAYDPLVALADMIKFDVRALGPEGVRKQLAPLKRRPIKFVASKVESQEEFRACRAMGIQYFQGFYFARPETLSIERMDPQFLRAAQIFNLVAANAGPKRIEAEMRHDVALSFNLLRYINSPALAPVTTMASVRHAIVILGPTKFAKWLSLLMVSGSPQSQSSPALFRAALTRARFAELLGREKMSDADADALFLAGMFSLLEPLTGMPMRTALKDINVAEPVHEALCEDRGPYAPYVALCEACERADTPRIEVLTRSIGMDVGQVTVAHFEALRWAEQIDN